MKQGALRLPDWLQASISERARPLPIPSTVTCYTPKGDPVQVLAREDAHAAWLIAVNPRPPAGSLPLDAPHAQAVAA